MALFPLLVFDLDGTLVDSLPDLTAALNRMMAKDGLPAFTDTEIRPMIGDGTPRLIQRAFAARGQTPKPDDHEAFVADYTAHVADATRAYPHVAETLAILEKDGWRLAICTNKSTASTKAVLGALNLTRWFVALGCGDSFAAHKPDPAHLRGTIEIAGGAGDCAIMIGDHANDIAVAVGLGCPGVFAAWGYGAPSMAKGAAAVAQRFADLPAIAARLRSAN
jgi:phosphoglycolate phosphatase